MFAVTVAAVQAWTNAFGAFSGASDLAEFTRNMMIVFGYILCYCLTTAALRMTVLRSVATPNLSVIAAFLGVFLFLAPYLTAFFVSRNWDTVLPWYLLGSPMVLTTTNESAKDVAQWVMLGWIAVSMLAGAFWTLGQWRRFTPYESAVVKAEAAE